MCIPHSFDVADLGVSDLGTRLKIAVSAVSAALGIISTASGTLLARCCWQQKERERERFMCILCVHDWNQRLPRTQDPLDTKCISEAGWGLYYLYLL